MPNVLTFNRRHSTFKEHLHPSLFAIGMGVATTIGVKIGAFLAQAHQITSGWTIDLATVGAVLAIVVPGAFYIGRSMARFDSRLEQGDKRFGSIEADIKRIMDRIETLPCKECEHHHHKRS